MSNPLLTLATALPEVKKYQYAKPIHGYFRPKIYVVLGIQVDCFSTCLLFYNIK